MEIYAHGVVARIHEEPELETPLFVIEGKDWEGNPFSVFLREDEAKSLLTQLGYLCY